MAPQLLRGIIKLQNFITWYCCMKKTDDLAGGKLKTKRYRDTPIHSEVYYFTKEALKIEKDIIMDCYLTFYIRADEQPC